MSEGLKMFFMGEGAIFQVINAYINAYIYYLTLQCERILNGIVIN